MWDTRYRPLTFEDVLGQQGTVLTLKARLRNGTALNTNYIFGGGHGQGKTTLARIMARAILCQQLNKEDPEPCNKCDNCRDILNESSNVFFERDAASQGSKESIRAIVDDLPFAVIGAPKRVYLFDEAHRLTKDAQDVLLKPMEDGKLVAMLCTTEPDKLRGAIASRCEGAKYTVRKVTRDDVLERMRKVLNAEGVTFEDDAVLTVIDHSGGHVRDVLNRLEMIGQLGAITQDTVREYLNLGVVSLYYDILLALGDAGLAISLTEQACDLTTPDDVTAGIAEAAMNSYRLANGMHADFVYVDREKAQRVWSRFGLGCVELAEFFLRSRHTTRISLVCDVARRSNGPIAMAPVVQQVPTPPQPPPPPVPIEAPPAVGAASVASPDPVAPPPVPAIAQAPTPAPQAPRKGALGSNDPMALTVDDLKAIPKDMPRGSHKAPPPLDFSGKGNSDLDPITPEEWRREFEVSWASLGSGQR